MFSVDPRCRAIASRVQSLNCCPTCGQLLSSKAVEPIGIAFCRNNICEPSGHTMQSCGSGVKRMVHPEGQYEFTASGGEYRYAVKDHLGNVRLLVGAAGNEVQQSAYYPFGGRFMAGGASDNPYQYAGAELEDDAVGYGPIGWVDLGARMYDPALGRFFAVDPMAAANHLNSPYSYAANNPVCFTDWMGLYPKYDKNGPCSSYDVNGDPIGGWYDSDTGICLRDDEVVDWLRDNNEFGGDPMADLAWSITVATGKSVTSSQIEELLFYTYSSESTFIKSGLSSEEKNANGTRATGDYVLLVIGGKKRSNPTFNREDMSKGIEYMIGVQNASGRGREDPQGQGDVPSLFDYFNSGFLGGVSTMLGGAENSFNWTPKDLRRKWSYQISKINGAPKSGQIYQGWKQISKTANTWGKRFGYAGALLSTGDYIINFDKASIGKHTNYWTSTTLFALSVIPVTAPVFAPIGFIYGASQLGTFMVTGKSIEENWIDQ